MKAKQRTDWSRKILVMCLIAAFAYAAKAAIDNYMVRHVVVNNDRLTAASFYLVLGAWIGVFVLLICNKLFGKQIDKDYTGFNWGTKKVHLFTSISGIAGTLAALVYFLGSQLLDPSLVLGLSNLSIVYIAIFGVFIKKRIRLSEILLPGALVIAGSLMISVQHLSMTGIKISIWGIIIFAVIRSLLTATGETFRKEGAYTSDAIIFSFWRYAWLTISATTLMLATAAARGRLNEWFQMIETVSLKALGFISITMILAFLFNSLSQKAMRTAALSKVSLVLNSKIAFGVPIALIANWQSPGIFGLLPTDPRVWVIRCIGVMLVIYGIVQLAIKEKRSQS